jgi:hypothetical protein
MEGLTIIMIIKSQNHRYMKNNLGECWIKYSFLHREDGPAYIIFGNRNFRIEYLEKGIVIRRLQND